MRGFNRTYNFLNTCDDDGKTSLLHDPKRQLFHLVRRHRPCLKEGKGLFVIIMMLMMQRKKNAIRILGNGQ